MWSDHHVQVQVHGHYNFSLIKVTNMDYNLISIALKIEILFIVNNTEILSSFHIQK